MDQRILVIGATGTLGKPVTKQLHTDGFKVKVLAPDPQRARNKLGNGFEIVQGDVTDSASVFNAMDDCDCVYISLNSSTFKELQEIEYQGDMNIIRAAVKKHLKRISIITGPGINTENVWSPVVKVKYKIEQEIIGSGIPYTLFSTTHFMDSIPEYIKGDKAMIFGKQFHKIHWIAAIDFARMVSRSFQRKEAENKKFWIMGPEAYTMEEAFTKYCKLKYPHVQVTKIPLFMLNFMATLSFNMQLKYMVQLMKYFNRAGETGYPEEANNLLGKPSTILETWLTS